MLLHNYGHHGDGLGSVFARIFSRIAGKVVAKTAARTAARAAAKTAARAAKRVAVSTLKTAAKKVAPLAKEAAKEVAKEAAKFGAAKATEAVQKLAGTARSKGVPVNVVNKIVSAAEGGIKSGQVGLANIVESSLKRKPPTPKGSKRPKKIRRRSVGQALIEAL